MNQIEHINMMEAAAFSQGADATTPIKPASAQSTVPLWHTRYGIVQAAGTDNLVAQSLSNYGEWAERELDIMAALLDEGSVALQYGAEHGAQTLGLSRIVGDTGQIHVVEPRRLAHITLCTSVALNGLHNVYPHHATLGDRNGHVDLPASPGHPEERAHLAALDSIELPALQLLKINPLGCLLPVLAGGGDTLSQHKPAIYFRLSTMDLAVSEIAALKAKGYRCWSHLPHLYNPSNFSGNKRNVYPGFVHQNVIAVHQDASTGFEHLVEL
jgi:FkbM family methyltransferase